MRSGWMEGQHPHYEQEWHVLLFGEYWRMQNEDHWRLSNRWPCVLVLGLLPIQLFQLPTQQAGFRRWRQCKSFERTLVLGHWQATNWICTNTDFILIVIISVRLIRYAMLKWYNRMSDHRQTKFNACYPNSVPDILTMCINCPTYLYCDCKTGSGRSCWASSISGRYCQTMRSSCFKVQASGRYSAWSGTNSEQRWRGGAVTECNTVLDLRVGSWWISVRGLEWKKEWQN